VAKAFSDERKASVLAAIAQGMSVHAASREFAVSRAAIMRWREASGLGTHQVAPQKREEIGELVTDLLRAILITVRIQAEAYRDTAWLKKYSPSDAGVNTGILSDKAIRILEALECPAEKRPDTETDAS